METELEILKDLVNINSNCEVSNTEIAEYIKRALAQFEIQEFHFKKVDLDLVNLIVKIDGISSESPLVFVGHTDTVPPSESWTRNPFGALIEGDKLYGLGSGDMKAAVACMIAAAKGLREKPGNDVYMIFDADEEGSLTGGRHVLEHFSLSHARVVVGEPSNRTLVFGQKGCLDLEIIITGQALHSSKTSLENNYANNAIYKAIAVGKALIAYEQAIEKKRDELFGRPSLNMGLIQGGIAPNIVADRCSLKISRRLLPEERIDEVYQEIKSLVAEVSQDTTTQVLFWGESYKGDENGPFAHQLKKVAQQVIDTVSVGIQPFWTEAALFCRYGEAIIFGPGSGAMNHKPNEYVEIADVLAFKTIYSRLMSGN